MKKILFVHGLGGKANGRVAEILREHMGDEYIIDAPEIPIKPEEALAFIDDLILNNDYDMAVGSSLGAFYLMKTIGGLKKVLINPAVEAGHYIEKYIGYGEHCVEGNRPYTIDKDFISALKNMELDHDDEEECYYMCYVSTEDELFGSDNAKNCRKYFLEDNIVFTTGSHRVPEEIVVDTIIPGIKEFMDSEISLPPIYLYGTDSRFMSPEIFGEK